MRFSDYYGFNGADEEWFDPFLATDTKLFVDPFRIYVDKDPPWQGSHDHLIEFFNVVMKLVAKAMASPKKTEDSPHWKAAERLLLFPEPAEFCLGYGETPLGAGSADGLREGMLEGAQAAINAGITSIEHFEELTLFEEGIGADRISDIACNVLKQQFTEYTQAIAREHGVPTEEINVPHADWDTKFTRWIDGKANLPLNPYTGRAVLLVPDRFLVKLPTIEPEDFWDWAWSNANDELRGQFNYDLGQNVDGAEIARLARRKPDLAKKYVKRLEQNPKPPYNLTADPAGDVSWYDNAKAVAGSMSAPDAPESADEFCEWVKSVLEAFAHDVNHSSWRLLWTTQRPRAEKYVQRLLRTAVWQICRERDVDFTGEPEAGRGPADFKLSKGWKRRAIVEVKLANNSQFWDGIDTQTVIYMNAEQVSCGYFVSVGYRDVDFKDERVNRVLQAARMASKAHKITITPIFVDARPKKSASKADDPNGAK